MVRDGRSRRTARTRRAPRWDGLLVLGAVGGSAAGLGVGVLTGWTGPAASLAVLVGLDLGVLVGAGSSALVTRRLGRGPSATSGTVPPTG